MTANDISRSIPQAVEAEQFVLGALMSDNDSIDRIGDLRAEHFFRGDHRAIYSEIVDMLANGAGVDIITVFERLKSKGRDQDTGGLSYLNSLVSNTVSSANIGRWAASIRDRAQKRGLLTVASEIQERVGTSPDDANTLIDHAAMKLETLAEARIKREPKLVREHMATHMAVLDERMEGKMRVIPTGLPDLDDILSGGIRPGNVVVLGARPSVGKTALGLTVAANVAHDYGVLVLSLEMTQTELNDRLIAMLGRVSLDSVLKARESDSHFWNSLTATAHKINELSLVTDDQGGVNLLDVRNKARAAKRKHGIDLLVVDYLQLMNGRDESQTRNYQLEEISRGIKALAKELGIGVIELVQLNRAADGGARFKMKDIRDCGSIEQDADVIAFLHRPIKDNPDLGSDFANFAWLQVEKNRQGACRDIALFYQGDQTRFDSWSGQWPQASGGTRRRSKLED
jgi:replicative DNA helicase